MPYQYLDDVATADIAFEAYGQSKEEMFIAASDALMNVMVEDLAAIADKERRDISVGFVFSEESLEMLLFQFLQEFIFYKDAEELLLRVSEVRIQPGGQADNWTLKAQAYGEVLDPKKHQLNVDVKAVTMHQFAVTENQGQWKARVVLDI